MASNAKSQVKLIKGGTLIDGTGANPIHGASVLIEGSHIKAVGKEIMCPAGAEVIEAQGKTIMPGLIDCHLHFMGAKTGELIEKVTRPLELGLIRSISNARDVLSMGYTTAKDCGGDMNAVFLKKAVAEGSLNGLPRIVAAGYSLSQTYGHFEHHFFPIECTDVRTSRHLNQVGTRLVCDGVDECIKATRYALRMGSDFIKISTTGGIASERDTPYEIQFNPDEIKAIVETAAQVGKYVTAHCESSPRAMKQSILGGVKTIDHAFVTDDENIGLAKERGAIFVSTLSCVRIVKLVTAGDPSWDNSLPPETIEKMKPHVDSTIASYERIRKAGATLAMGTDTVGFATITFETNSVDLQLLVELCGFSPMEAIVAATKHGAMGCFMEDKTGTIEPGKFADILLIDGNPLADIKILQKKDKIKMVMLEGNVEINRC